MCGIWHAEKHRGTNITALLAYTAYPRSIKPHTVRERNYLICQPPLKGLKVVQSHDHVCHVQGVQCYRLRWLCVCHCV